MEMDVVHWESQDLRIAGFHFQKGLAEEVFSIRMYKA